MAGHDGHHGREQPLALALLAAGGNDGSNPFDADSATSSSTSPPTSTSMGSAMSTAADAQSDSSPLFDIEQADIDPTGIPPTCEVVDELDGVGECRISAPADSFNPEVQWTWPRRSGIQHGSAGDGPRRACSHAGARWPISRTGGPPEAGGPSVGPSTS